MKRLIDKLADRILLHVVRSRVISQFEGISIASTRDDGSRFNEVITGSLNFLREHDRRRFQTVCKSTDFIVERPLPIGNNSACYLHGIRMISIDYEPLDPGWDAAFRHGYVAGILVHEATHGRILDFGISTTEETRLQVERICNAEENRFYQRLNSIREGLTDQLLRPFDPADWHQIWSAGRFAKMRMTFHRLREESKRPPLPIQRSRPLVAMAGAIVMGTGLLWRSGHLPLSPFVMKYGGDAWWALLVFIGCGFVFARASTMKVASMSLCFAWGIEFLQLYHAPWIDSLRATIPGRLVLGSTFNPPDLIAYAVGIALGALAEMAMRHFRSPQRRN